MLDSPVPECHATSGHDVAHPLLSLRAASVRRIDSRHLLAGRNELVIEHAGQEHHLRLTRNDKLILTK